MLTIDFKKIPVLCLTLILSVLFHFISLHTEHQIHEPRIEDRFSNEPFEIVELPTQKKTKPMAIVQTQDAKNREENPDAKFLSDRTQKAEKDERSKNIGEFKDATGDGAQAASTSIAGAKNLAFPPDLTEDGGEMHASPEQLESLSLRDLSVRDEASSNDSVSKDVEGGSRTVLSTREFRYFSYYQRIRDLLRQHWGPNVQQKLMRLWQKGKMVNADEWTTQLHILLDRSGRVQKIAKISSCGVTDIDSAAVEAFEKAGPFPNPPRGLLDEDGFVRINWSFILTTESSPRVQFATPGYGGPP